MICCPRCNIPWEECIPENAMFPELYKSNCGLSFIPEDLTFQIYDLNWGEIATIAWRSNTSTWKKHCAIESDGKIIHTFSYWLPFDITEERLNKLLLLL